MVPTSTTSEGRNDRSSVSLSSSSAHMPREILRTVEPAKVLACHSVERRWTRAKPFRAMSPIVRKVSGTTRLQAMWRSIRAAKLNAVMAAKAGSATCSAAVRSATSSASTSRPA